MLLFYVSISKLPLLLLVRTIVLRLFDIIAQSVHTSIPKGSRPARAVIYDSHTKPSHPPSLRDLWNRERSSSEDPIRSASKKKRLWGQIELPVLTDKIYDLCIILLYFLRTLGGHRNRQTTFGKPPPARRWRHRQMALTGVVARNLIGVNLHSYRLWIAPRQSVGHQPERVYGQFGGKCLNFFREVFFCGG